MSVELFCVRIHQPGILRMFVCVQCYSSIKCMISFSLCTEALLATPMLHIQLAMPLTNTVGSFVFTSSLKQKNEFIVVLFTWWNERLTWVIRNHQSRMFNFNESTIPCAATEWFHSNLWILILTYMCCVVQLSIKFSTLYCLLLYHKHYDSS